MTTPERNNQGAPTTAASREAMESHLEDLLAEAEETASRLRRELAELRARPVAESEEDDEEKHAVIDDMFNNLQETQVHWGKVRSFIEAAVRELFGHHNDSKPTTDESSQEQA